jgi:hypothetical protein
MREMILNQASLAVPAAAIAIIVPLLRDLARGMATLVSAKCVSSTLRSQDHWYSIQCAQNGNLFDALNQLRATGARDDAVFLMRLTQKMPLLTDLGNDVVGRLLGCQATMVDAPYGDALVLSSHINAVAVSFPLHAKWDNSQLEVTFEELTGAGEIEDATETIDNLARSIHAPAILARDRTRALAEVTARSIWRDRLQLFPHLILGPDVEEHLQALNPGLLQTAANRLAELNASAEAWAATGGGIPPWRCRVTPESERVMNNPHLREARRFHSVSGARVIFAWHARFGSSGRVHLRFDPTSTTVEIGYIGVHLPL